MTFMVIVFAATVIFGVPLCFVLGMAGLSHIIALGNDAYFNVLIQRVFAGVDNIGLTCIPFFIIAGEIMNVGGVTKNACHTYIYRMFYGGNGGCFNLCAGYDADCGVDRDGYAALWRYFLHHDDHCSDYSAGGNDAVCNFKRYKDIIG